MKLIFIYFCMFLSIPIFVELAKWNQVESLYNKYNTQYPSLNRKTYEIIKAECDSQGFYLHIALAFAYSESRFKHGALSHSGARGLFQIMPFWTRTPLKLFDPKYNAKLGIKILKHYYKMANGNLILCCKYYNAGPRGRVFNGPYIVEICDNVVTSNPGHKAIDFLKI